MSITSSRESLVFRIDSKLLQRRPPRLTLAATLSALCKQVNSGDLNPNLVVEILNENQLLPYIITQPKSLHDISLGRHTNASKIGDIIVSEECIRGTYELCISFLEFVLSIIKNPTYQDTSKAMLASLTYACNEIYTSHHIWTYKDSDDMYRILALCTDIFHQVISNTKESQLISEYSELEIVCILSFSQNQAHKQLLDVIVDGSNYIKKKMAELKLTDEDGLKKVPIVVCVRKSLFIFNKILSHGKFISSYCDNQNPSSASANSQHLVSTSTTGPMTQIEKALFDTSIRPGLLQHLFGYIYHKEDSATACLAIDLIKKIAKKFSMSLMASLGSEADKVCEFFIGSMSSKESNVDLVTSILDLLSTCVKYQPGLIELFLNSKVDSKSPTSDKSEEKKPSSNSSLATVVGLLKDCLGRPEDSRRLLHSYLMKFILTFWQKNHSAIEQFAKADDFWESITHPLVKFLDSEIDQTSQTESPSNQNLQQSLRDKLNSYAFMILAREIFVLKGGITEREMSPKLKSKLEEISKKNILGKYSTFLRNKYQKISQNSTHKDDYNRFVNGWRDFLTSYTKYRPFEITSEVECRIVDDVMSAMTSELRLGDGLDRERIAALGDTLLLVWSKWMPKEPKEDDVFESIHQLLYMTDSCKELLPFSFLLTFQSTLNLYLARHRDILMKHDRSFDLLVPALQLMQLSLMLMEKNLREQKKNGDHENKPGIDSRLCQASISTFKFVVDISRANVSLWISYIQTNLKTDSMIHFLTIMMTNRAAPEVCLSMVDLLLCLSSIKETADYLNRSGFLDQVNMIAESAYERPYAHLSELALPISLKKDSINFMSVGNKQENVKVQEHPAENPKLVAPALSDKAKIYLDKMNSELLWLPVYWHIIRLNISMMLTLGKGYITTAIEFVSIHCIRMCEMIDSLRTTPTSINKEEVLTSLYLIDLILRHSSIWNRRSPKSYSAILEELGKIAYTLPLLTGQQWNHNEQIDYRLAIRQLILNLSPQSAPNSGVTFDAGKN